MKFAIAAATTAALVLAASAAARPTTPILVPHNGELVHLPGTNVGCGVVVGSKSGIFLCTRAGSRIWVAIGQTEALVVSVPAGSPITDILHGQPRYQTTWSGQETTPDSAIIANLQAKVAALTQQLAAANSALAAAQSGAVAAAESMGMSGVMTKFFPALAQWWQQQGGTVSQLSDSFTGYGNYSFTCDNCFTP